MPFAPVPAFHYLASAAFAMALVAMAAFIGWSEHQLRVQQLQEETAREAIMMAAVMESVYSDETVGTVLQSSVQSLSGRIAQKANHDVLVLTKDARFLTSFAYQIECDAGILSCMDATSYAKQLLSVVQSGSAPDYTRAVTILQASYTGKSVACAIVPMPAMESYMVVERLAPAAIVGSVVAVNAAVTAFCVWIAYVLFWRSAEVIASKPKTRWLGVGLCYFSQFVPLIIVGAFFAVNDTASHASQQSHLLDAQETLTNVVIAASALDHQFLNLGAVTALSRLSMWSFGSASTTALYIDGLTGPLPSWVTDLGIDPAAPPTAFLSGSIAVVSDLLSPFGQRILYATVAPAYGQSRTEAINGFPALLAILAVLLCIGLPAPAIGRSLTADRDTAPHFVNARSIFPLAAMVCVVIAALIPTAAITELVAAANDRQAEVTSRHQRALTVFSGALQVEAWHLKLIVGAMFGTAAAESFQVATPAAATTDAVLAAGRAEYATATTARVDRVTVIRGLQNNESLLFPDTGAQILALSAYSSEGLAAVEALENFKTVLPRYLWGQQPSVYTAESDAASRRVTNAATGLNQASYSTAASVLTGAIASAATSWPNAAKAISLQSAAPADELRSTASSAMDANVVLRALANVVSRADAAGGAVSAAYLDVPDVQGLRFKMQRDAIQSMAAAGYIAIAVAGAIASIHLVTTLGAAAWQVAFVPLSAVALLSFALRATEGEATTAAQVWLSLADATTTTTAWLANASASQSVMICEASLLLGSFLGNATLPAAVSDYCAPVSVTMATATSSTVELQLGFAGVPTSGSVFAEVSKTDRLLGDVMSAIALGCPATSLADSRYATQSHRTTTLRVPIATALASTDLTGVYTYMVGLSAALTTRLSDNNCNANVSTCATLYTDQARNEAMTAFVASQPWFAALAAASSALPFVSAVPGYEAQYNQLTALGVQTFVTSTSWIMILALWCVSVAAIWLHGYAYRELVKAANRLEF